MPEEKKLTSRERSNANLRPIPLGERSPAEQKAIRQKGAAAARAIKARKRALKEIMSDLLSMDYTGSGESLGELQVAAEEAAEEAGRPLTLYESIALAQMAQAQQGSTRAAEWVRDSAGDKPGDRLTADVSTVTPADLELVQAIQQRLQQQGGNNRA